MMALTMRGRLLSATLALAVGVAACADEAEAPFEPSFAVAESEGARAFEVYTQNLFHGGDTGPLLTLDFTDVPAVIAAANVFWNDVQAGDFPARAVEIVDELEQRGPHVVAFQEVFRVVVLDAAFQPIGGLDMLAVVEAEIASRGLPYATDIVQSNTSITLPLGFDPSIPGISSYLNVTDRIASLRRTDVELTGTDQGLYAARFPLVPGVELTRGWARTDVMHAGTSYHVVNTHLEVQQLAPVQAGQAFELQNVVATGLDGVTIVTGDLNSNAAGAPGDPTWTPTYGDLIGAGFTDLWLEAPPANRDLVGLTCCHPKNLVDAGPFDQRIDFVLVRSAAYEGLVGVRHGAYRAEIVGEEAGDRTDGGLWPSDHAGLVGSVRLPPGSN